MVLPAARVIRSYCTGLSRKAGIRCYPLRKKHNALRASLRGTARPDLSGKQSLRKLSV